MVKKNVAINSVLNMIKTVLTIVFPLITFPYALRVLGVYAIGRYSFAKSVVNYFVILSGLGIGRYAVREGAKYRDNKKEFSCFANQMLSLNLMSSFFSYLLLFIMLICSNKIFDYREIIVIQSLTIFFTTIGMDWVNSCYEEYAYITIRTCVVQILSMVLMFVLVHDEGDLIKYVCICLISNIGANVLNIFYVRKFFDIHLSLHGIKKHLWPVMLLFASSVASTIYVNADSTMLGVFCGDYSVGIYEVSTRVYSVIQQFISAAILVTLPRISNYIYNNNIKEVTNLIQITFNGIVLIVLPTTLGMLGMSENIIELVAGKEYLASVIPLQILAISLFVSIFSIFFTNTILLPLEHEKEITIFMILAAICNLLLNFVAIPYLECVGAAMTTVVAEVLVLLLQINFVRKDKIFKGVFYIKNFKSVLLGNIFVVIIICINRFVLSDGIFYTFFTIFLSVFGYLIILLLMKNEFIVGIWKSCLKKF